MSLLRTLKKLPIIHLMYKWLFILVGKLPVNNRLIIFESFLGKQYSCNPRAIYEYMEANHPEYEMLWSIDPRYVDTFKENNIPYIKRFSVGWLFKLARAGYWVSNSRMPVWIPKPKHTVYLQTWHGTPLKKLAFDLSEILMAGTDTEKYKKEFFIESRNWDYLISPNRYSTEIFKSAFKFEKEMIESGYPRNDILHNPRARELTVDLKKKYKLPSDKKVILYAPTWRDNQYHEVGKYSFDLQLNLKKMQEVLDNEYVIVLRMHYLIAENFDLSDFEGFVYDFSLHGDIRELFLMSDLLITDYSSVFFDYANLRRPIIFFVYDIESYRDELRGFYFDLQEEAPGPLVQTTEEVIEEIKKYEQQSILPSSYEAFYQNYCYLEDGEATKRVVEKVFN